MGILFVISDAVILLYLYLKDLASLICSRDYIFLVIFSSNGSSLTVYLRLYLPSAAEDRDEVEPLGTASPLNMLRDSITFRKRC